MHDSSDADQFALIDIDGDGIGELVASDSEGSWEKDQVFLFTVKDREYFDDHEKGDEIVYFVDEEETDS